MTRFFPFTAARALIRGLVRGYDAVFTRRVEFVDRLFLR
jgi:hypothetical protein